MESGELYFSVKGMLAENPVSPNNISLPILNDLVEAMMKFIKGDSSRTDLGDISVAVRQGSFALAAQPSEITIAAITDFKEAYQSGNLNSIDPIRAKVIADLQEKANKNSELEYVISDGPSQLKDHVMIINKDSHYSYNDEELWIPTEMYLYGRVFNMGGKNQPNIHIGLQNGDTIKVDADMQLLANDNINRLYKDQLVKVNAEQNLQTKKLRKESLIGFENYMPSFDEQDFLKTVEQVEPSWKDVPNELEWLESIRGNYV